MMKLLFDENISYRIVKKIEKLFPESAHVSNFNLLKFSDFKIWNFAKKNKFTIVTNDSDFNDILNFYNFPPKIIWLKIGNSPTNKIFEKLEANFDLIVEFLNDKEKGLLIIY